PVTACERCGKPVQRLISSPAIMFKGSGWYITDYSDKMKPPTDGEKKDVSNGEKKDSTATSPAAPAPAGTPSAAPVSTPASPPASSPAAAPSPSSSPSSSSDK
ncbi:FmdB family zinc ribbon protein, partial [Petrachloros mirabilis]